VQPLETPLTDWDAVAQRISAVRRHPACGADRRGQALASSPFNSGRRAGARHPLADLVKLGLDREQSQAGTLEGFDGGQGLAIGRRLSDQLSVRAGDNITLVAPRGAVTPMGTTPRIRPTRSRRCSRSACRNTTARSCSCRLPEAQLYSTAAGDVTAIEVYTNNPDRIENFRRW
jgi:lipoprotein-releasing system permease protein